MVKLHDLMEPEETVGNLWHDMASRWGEQSDATEQAASFDAVRPSIKAVFVAMGGSSAVEIVPAPLGTSPHRPNRIRRISTPHEKVHVADFDGDRLRLPPTLEYFQTYELNRACYLWLAALAAFVKIPEPDADPLSFDRSEISELVTASEEVFANCRGLRPVLNAFCDHIVKTRRRAGLPRVEAEVEKLICGELLQLSQGGTASRNSACGISDMQTIQQTGPAPRTYRSYAPVLIWLRLRHSKNMGKTQGEDTEPPAPAFGLTTRKDARREDRDQANRRDSFIVHRFESIMSWAESMNINRMVDDDNQDNAAKAVDDQDHLTLSKTIKRAATRLRVSLDLSPQDAEHEALAGTFTYPEWNRRTGNYMPDHTRVLEADVQPGTGYQPEPRLVARVRRQFAPLHPRRVSLPRQIDGDDLDLDAVVASRTDIACGHDGSDRIWQSNRPMARDLSVAILMDCSRSTEVALGETTVIDVARDALAALAGGIDTAGDRLGIWGFSSLRRDRVFLHRAKSFAEPMSQDVTARIGNLRPGHYTRLGAAIRHTSAELAKESATRRLLLILTDGKPNDLDHYEGQHGIEDSRMAVREARSLGQAVHGVIIDEDGQDWFARIFSRGGFTLLPHPEKLPRALPNIYQTLTMEH